MKEGIIIFGIICLILVSIFLIFQNLNKHIESTIFKGLASLTFVLFGFYQIILINKIQVFKVDINYTIFLYIGLILGLIGDIFLNIKDLYKNKLKLVFTLIGVISFLFGHIFYIIHQIKITCLFNDYGIIDASKIFIPILISLLLVGLISIFILKFVNQKGKLKIIPIVYVFIISLLVCLTGFNMINALINLGKGSENLKNYFIIIFSGNLAFAITDIVIIFNSFGRKHSDILSAINLYIYYISQLLIGLSIYFFYLM